MLRTERDGRIATIWIDHQPINLLDLELMLALDAATAEVALGILPGGSGTQRLARLVGRARALEAVVGCDDVDGETAERWGWVNRALAPAGVEPFVERLARRVASYPPGAVAAAKAAVDAAGPDHVPGLRAESAGFAALLGTPDARRLMQGFLDGGGQTAAVEGDHARLQALLEALQPD